MPDENEVPPLPAADSGRSLRDYNATELGATDEFPPLTTPTTVRNRRAQVFPESGPIRRADYGGSSASETPFKPFPFALRKSRKNGKSVVYHGRLVHQINRITIGPDGLVTQGGLGVPQVFTPSQFDGGDGSRYKFVEMDWVGDIYLYWETNGHGAVTMCDLRGPALPDHVPLPLPKGQTVAKFSVKLGSTDASSAAGVEQDIASDVWWLSAFVEEDSSNSDSSDDGSSSSSSESSSDGSSTGSSEGSSTGSSTGSSDGSSTGGSSTGTSDSGSDKSTAIVPASWSPTGYAALFIHEMPEVRFDDIMEIRVQGPTTVVQIDPRFVEVCEPDSIRACSAVANIPVAVGVSVSGGSLVIRCDLHPATVVVRLTGIRKGFSGHRFPLRSREQFLANEEFINSAYPAT